MLMMFIKMLDTMMVLMILLKVLEKMMVLVTILMKLIKTVVTQIFRNRTCAIPYPVGTEEPCVGVW